MDGSLVIDGGQREDLLAGKPWYDSNSEVWFFRIGDYLVHRARHHEAFLSTEEIRRIIESFGGGTLRISVRSKPIHCYYVPVRAFHV